MAYGMVEGDPLERQVLIRMHSDGSGMQVIPTAEMLTMAQQAVEAWAPLAGQPHLNPLRGALISADLGGIPSLILAHDYHPGAVTLEAAHLLPATNASGLVGSLSMHAYAPVDRNLYSFFISLRTPQAVPLPPADLEKECLNLFCRPTIFFSQIFSDQSCWGQVPCLTAQLVVFSGLREHRSSEVRFAGNVIHVQGPWAHSRSCQGRVLHLSHGSLFVQSSCCASGEKWYSSMPMCCSHEHLSKFCISRLQLKL